MRRLLVSIRDAFDGWRHPHRRRAAHERIRSRPSGSVLFVCLGNICRSPYAARALARDAPGSEAESAGFIGPDRPPPDEALEAAARRGVDHGDHRSTTLTPDQLAAADLVFVFDRYNASRLRRETSVDPAKVFWLGDLDPQWTGKRAIIDPWGRGQEAFETTFDRIDRCVADLASLRDR